MFHYTDASGNSVHHALTLQAIGRARRYFRLNANHTFAKTLDDGKFLVFVDTPQSNDRRSVERAVSSQNVRHRFIANFVITGQPLPVPRHYKDGVGSPFVANFGAPHTTLNPRQFQVSPSLPSSALVLGDQRFTLPSVPH